MSKNTVFGQIVQLLSRREFQKIVSRCDGDKHIRKLDCWQQLLILICTDKGANEFARD